MASVPRQLNQRHLVAARLVAAGRGRREVAQAVGWHPSTVSHVARSPAFQEAVVRFGRRLDAAVMAASLDRLLGPSRPCPRCGHTGTPT